MFISKCEAIISKIHILSAHITNQIAAGEVIEDASSVVKELVENALDAGASRLEIETLGGGQGLIVVRDNGFGMSNEDMIMSLNRHATSKISTFDDLYSLSTLGFRGEALASIAAISKMTMCSSCNNSGKGYLLRLEEGSVTRTEPSSRTKGTTIEVSSLFYNVPVRRNFQKTELSSRNKLRKLIETMVLGTPEVGWRWISEGREELFIEPEASFEYRVSYIIGAEFFKESWSIEASRGAIALTGRLGQPSCYKFNKQSQKWFVNGRSVECPFLSRRVTDAFHSFLPPQRYPSFVLNLTLPQGWYDVNVHPQKKDIRIKQEYLVGNFIYETVSDLLLEKAHTYESTDVIKSTVSIADDKMPTVGSAINFYAPESYKSFRNGSSFSWEDIDRKIERSEDNLLPSRQSAMPFLGEVSFVSKLGGLLLAEDVNGLYLVNKQRARKHILFNFKKFTSREKQTISNQLLLKPLDISLNQEEEAVLCVNQRIFEILGFCFEQNDDRKHLLTGYPNFVEEKEAIEFLKALLNYMFFECAAPEWGELVFRKLSLERTFGWSVNDSELLKQLWAIGKPDTAFDGGKIYKKLSESDLLEVFENEHTTASPCERKIN